MTIYTTSLSSISLTSSLCTHKAVAREWSSARRVEEGITSIAWAPWDTGSFFLSFFEAAPGTLRRRNIHGAESRPWKNQLSLFYQVKIEYKLCYDTVLLRMPLAIKITPMACSLLLLDCNRAVTFRRGTFGSLTGSKGTFSLKLRPNYNRLRCEFSFFGPKRRRADILGPQNWT